MARQRALHRSDDVAALAERSKDCLEIRRETPAALAYGLGQSERGELLQAAGADRSFEHFPRRGRNLALAIHVAKQTKVGRGQAFGADVDPQPPSGLELSARPKIERQQLCEPLAHPALEILGRDHEIAAMLVLAPEHDVGMRVERVVMVSRDPV